MPNDDPTAVSSEAVAFRVLAMTAVSCRASADQVLRQGPHPVWEETMKAIERWLVETGVENHLSNLERELMETPVGLIEDDQLFEQNWRLQAVGALLWSIGKVDPMPTYATFVLSATLMPLVPLTRPIDAFLASATLRPLAVLEAERTRAQFWNWRSRCEMFRRQGMAAPTGQSYEQTLESAARSAFEQGVVTELAEDGSDVAFDGVPYAELDNESFANAGSTALERHRALNWVLGDGEDWDLVSTDT